MIDVILVIEDKKEERDAAMQAIKKLNPHVTELAEAEFMGLVALKSSNAEGGLMVWLTPDLEWAKHRLELLQKITKVLGDKGRVGVITDLMLPARKDMKDEPNGLIVISKCIEAGLPVVVCSDTDHHDVAWLRPVFPILGKAHPVGNIPVILDKKDWEKALNLLAEIWQIPTNSHHGE